MKEVSLNYTLDSVKTAASFVILNGGSSKLWCFYGKMGVGKTTLIKEICVQLGVKDQVSSPSFSLVNEYKTETDNKIFHFDFYRIIKIEEVYDIGFEEYFYSDSICLIEWPEKIKEILDNEPCYTIKLTAFNGDRKLVISQ